MQVVINPDSKDWKHLLQRPYVDNSQVLNAVQSILHAVKQHGDEAVIAFTKKYDGFEAGDLKVSENEFKHAESLLTDELKEAIQQARQNIEAFHLRQLSTVEKIETMPGVQCWRKSVGIEKVGLYVPGGTAPLFSTVLMLGIPAIIAGCKEICLCTPANAKGEIHPAVLYAASAVGINTIYKIGGAQAIAAMAFGTQTIPAVDKIFGPGNQYVTAAKQCVQMQGVAIDMPAGPSEVCVWADETANPSFIAADLLSQAEHGPDSQVLLVTTESLMVDEVQTALEEQLSLLPRAETARQALRNSKAVVVNSKDTALDLVNAYAAEHLIIACSDADELAQKVVNAGSVFIGNYSPESVGDYASGTNHTLPTNGFARAYSGVSVDSFVKKITYQKLTQEGLQKIAPTVVAMAEAEGLKAHAEAVRVRLAPPQKRGVSDKQISKT
jgi:histidinol dehydrogenase